MEMMVIATRQICNMITPMMAAVSFGKSSSVWSRVDGMFFFEALVRAWWVGLWSLTLVF